jgi:archaellum component FlaF (FlaF/FlaG flagellin family)
MEGGPHERYTDNNPLDRGKISAKEGGTRVPLIIAGPGIAKDVQTDVVVNGLDFYPTLLALTGSKISTEKNLDGCDLSALLLKNPKSPMLVKNIDGSVRDTMVWHFPHGNALESTIRIGDYKLIRNYDHVNYAGNPELELFQLYKTSGNKQTRVDIEESDNLATALPEKTAAMNRKLSEVLTEMKASYPGYNPNYTGELPNKELVPTVLSYQLNGDAVEFAYTENGAKVERADLIYTLNGGDRFEEWFSIPADLLPGMKVSVEVPEGTTHFVLNLIDENNFLISYPDMAGAKGEFSERALSVEKGAPAQVKKMVAPPGSVDPKDTNKDGQVSEEEYVGYFAVGFDRKDKNNDGVLTPDEHPHASFTRADQDNDNQLTREEFVSIFERQFSNLDKNNGGFITASEMK